MATDNKFQKIGVSVWFLVAAVLWSATGSAAEPKASADLHKIRHIVVIYMENRSFDNLYGLFPGANGLSRAGAAATQVEKDGTPYKTLPPVLDIQVNPPVVDTRFPLQLPNAPFRIDQYVPADQAHGDLVHNFYNEQMQIDGGKMDKYVAWSNAGAMTMGYYDGSQSLLWRYAQKYTLADNFFHASFGGSFSNHFWMVCACMPRYENAPPDMVSELDAKGLPVKERQITPDGYAVNTTQSVHMPHSSAITDPRRLLPPQKGDTIGDRLTAKGVTWAWYSGGWNDAIKGKPDPSFQFHHQPLAYFEQFADGTAKRRRHLRDGADLNADIANGRLPKVVFFKPLGSENQHPGYATVAKGDEVAANLIERIRKSRYWHETAIILTYDENGGLWDHVAPPKVDRWGPGTRVPTLIISPYAKKGYIDHTLYDTTSILKFIEHRFDLAPLGTRDAAANDLTNAFTFSSGQP
ncbi:MAG: sulfatase-like hydrolase/transferase [Alphaproteobacteria bacterium]|nr:sulfatase-like hydrolase/transferase [Alphaproteobacteria bacterium]